MVTQTNRTVVGNGGIAQTFQELKFANERSTGAQIYMLGGKKWNDQQKKAKAEGVDALAPEWQAAYDKQQRDNVLRSNDARRKAHNVARILMEGGSLRLDNGVVNYTSKIHSKIQISTFTRDNLENLYKDMVHPDLANNVMDSNSYAYVVEEFLLLKGVEIKRSKNTEGARDNKSKLLRQVAQQLGSHWNPPSTTFPRTEFLLLTHQLINQSAPKTMRIRFTPELTTLIGAPGILNLVKDKRHKAGKAINGVTLFYDGQVIGKRSVNELEASYNERAASTSMSTVCNGRTASTSTTNGKRKRDEMKYDLDESDGDSDSDGPYEE